MSTLSVGSGQTYSTIAAAVSAAQSGDTIDVSAGTYTNDFISVSKSLTFNAVGGIVTMAATVSPPNGKAIVTEGAAGISVAFDGFAFTGASVADANGAGIRYEGGNLTITNSHLYGNQDGLLANNDPAGTITISNSEIDHNGVGDGYSHNIYVGDIQQFTLTNSYIHDANYGHEVKSRAENNTITGNRIFDNDSTSSYEIDLPNGGNATISGNVIEQGVNSGNPTIIAYGEEGNLHAGTSLSVTGNTIINDEDRGLALWNAGGGTASFQNNAVFGLGSTALVLGAAIQSGTTLLTTRPSLDLVAPTSVPAAVVVPPVVPAVTPAVIVPPVVPTVSVPVSTPVSTPVSPPVSTTPVSTPVSTGGLVLNVSEEAWQGDAQYTVSVDGVQVGGVRTATASHDAGASEPVAIGPLSAGPHSVGVTFLNDAYGGSPSTDRNLFVDGATYDGAAVAGAGAALHANGGTVFSVGGDQPAATGLVVNVAEDAWQGDARCAILVDGQQVGPVQTATASHAAGQSQAISVATTLGTGAHTLGIAFLNDAYGGSPGTDRNLYVTGATYDGQAIPNSTFEESANGTSTLGFSAGSAATSTVTSTATLMVSEDAWQGDAQFTVAVDGQQFGGVYTATASHAAGQSQAITITGIAESFTPHDIAVTFLNDAYGGSPAADRNLFVSAIQFDNQPVSGASLSLYAQGTQHVTAVAPAGWAG